LALLGSAAPALAENSAVVLMYHRFGDSRYPSTNIRIDQFEEHVRELTNGKYKVMGLPEIVAAIKEKRPLPDRTVGLSIDDGFLSIYANAWPRLRAAKLPFTLFVATDDVDKRLPDFMSWEQLRELAKAGVTIGVHTASHAHLPRLTSEQVQAEITKSNARFRAELGKQPELFAYPYGEFRSSLRDIVVKAGYVAAFGQHSGVIHPEADTYYLPRFAMAEAYGDRTRVRDALNALPFVVADVSPADPFLTAKDNPPHLGFTVKGEAARSLDKLRCFAPRRRPGAVRGRRQQSRRGSHRPRVSRGADADQLHRARRRQPVALVQRAVPGGGKITLSVRRPKPSGAPRSAPAARRRTPQARSS
jgi:peptidoglycan/xylan/chitin deacetylase (PgdA/CDA1 family)